MSIPVLCTGNSARSIPGEAISSLLAAGRGRAYSAGSRPKGVPDPGAVRLLERCGIAPSATPAFIACQLLGARIAFGVAHLFFPEADLREDALRDV